MKRRTSFFLIVLVAVGFVAAFGADATQAALSSDTISSNLEKSVLRIGVQITGNVLIPDTEYNPETDEFEILKTFTKWPATVSIVGTGFVVHPDGYIVTNAHVVDITEETVRDYIWEEYSRALYDELAAEYGEEGLQPYVDAIVAFVQEHGDIQDLQNTVRVFRPDQLEGTYDSLIANGYSAEVKKMGQPFPSLGKDVAVIKIDKENLPALALGSSAKVKQGQRVYVMGFPVIADLNESSLTKPTFTSGVVSSIKKSSQGDYDVIQIDAAIHGGNSGGPAVNENGDVIGIATFGALSSQGFNWILPIDLAKTDLNELNVAYKTPGWKFSLNDRTTLMAVVGGGAVVIIGLMGALVVISRRKRVVVGYAPSVIATTPSVTTMAPPKPTAPVPSMVVTPPQV